MKYKSIAVLLLGMLLCALPFAAYAHETPDTGAACSVTVEMKYDGEAVAGGTLAAYRVGQVQESDGNYSFVKTDAMSAFDGSYDDISSAAAAENIAAFVNSNGVSPCAAAENINGEAAFTGLETGLYLIVQTKASDGYEPLKPFLVALPANDGGHYVYDVTAEGKFQLYRAPKPAAPQKPADPTLPQTGQLNWPVPLLAALGVSLFSAGWALRFGKKKSGCAG